MIADSPFADQITPGARTRSYDEQVRLWNNYQNGTGPMAARPGTSRHGNGEANDLKYGSPEARAWVLANAERYGLHLPIYDPSKPRSKDESWHIELKGGGSAGGAARDRGVRARRRSAGPSLPRVSTLPPAPLSRSVRTTRWRSVPTTSGRSFNRSWTS